MDSQFPDITSKPGAFLPSIFDQATKGEFDVEKVDKQVMDKATDLQQKLVAERQKHIDNEKSEREKAL